MSHTVCLETRLLQCFRSTRLGELLKIIITYNLIPFYFFLNVTPERGFFGGGGVCLFVCLLACIGNLLFDLERNQFCNWEICAGWQN